MTVSWSDIQRERLRALGAVAPTIEAQFDDVGSRNTAFQRFEKELVTEQKRRLQELRDGARRTKLSLLESRLTGVLVDNGFVQVATPTIMSKGHLARMSIDANHPLSSQVFWLDDKTCLRPMLAPHLYYVLKDLLRLWEKPVRIFEVGSCFRKESSGARHSTEFTMLNLVEMGLELESRESRLKELAALIVEAAGIDEHELQTEESTIYGQTIDIVAGEGRVELGSAAMGPHPLDQPWRIAEPWVGIGFGLERLLMVAEGSESLGRVGRSLAYLNGVPLNI